jgi:DNA-binding transcriptional regulator YiaG
MDKNALLTKLKSYEKSTKKRSVDINASFSTLTDEEILLVMAHRAKKLRIQNNLKQSVFSKSANLSSASTYSNFEQNGKVSLLNFIKIVRSFGQISVFENILKSDISAVIEGVESGGKVKKRVR